MKAEQRGVYCEWKEDDEGTWWTSCREAFVLTDSGQPSEHKMRFCCYCGFSLDEVKYIEPPLAEEAQP